MAPLLPTGAVRDQHQRMTFQFVYSFIAWALPCPHGKSARLQNRTQLARGLKTRFPLSQPLLVRTIRRELLFGHALLRASMSLALGSGMLVARAIRTACLARALLTSRGRLHAQMLPTSSPPPRAAWRTRSATSRRSHSPDLPVTRACSCIRSFSCQVSRSLSLQCSRSLVQLRAKFRDPAPAERPRSAHRGARGRHPRHASVLRVRVCSEMIAHRAVDMPRLSSRVSCVV